MRIEVQMVIIADDGTRQEQLITTLQAHCFSPRWQQERAYHAVKNRADHITRCV